MALDRRLLWQLSLISWVLILMCCQPLAGASQLPYQKALQEFKFSNKPQVIRAELDHPDSPFSLPSGASASAAASVSREQSRIARRLGAGVEFKSSISVGTPYESGSYVMTLYLGTPVQRFVVSVDTGSDLVWVQCRPCKSPYPCYNETDPFFDPSASTSYSPVPCRNSTQCAVPKFKTQSAGCNGLGDCEITFEYGTPGSRIAGVLSTETISFSNTTEGQLGIADFRFGCMNNDTPTFGAVDGLVGFGRGPLSLPSQLSHLTSSNVFSYCLVRRPASANLTSPLLFGASNSNGLDLVYTPILTYPDFPSFYWVNMTGISINGTAVRLPEASLVHNSTSSHGGTVFDSGTTDTTFTEDIARAVLETFKDLIPYPIVQANNTGLCYNISGVEHLKFTSVSLQFSGVNGSIVDFPFAPNNLFFPVSYGNGTVRCSSIVPGEFGFNIIGNIAQADHYIETDLENMRIGWTSKDCSLPM